MIETKKEEIERVSWNLRQLLIYDIGDLLRSASVQYVKRNYAKVFDYLKAAKMRVVAYLNAEEIQKLADMEIKAYGYINATKPTGFNTLSEDTKKNQKDLWLILDSYNNLLFSLLKKYGLLIPIQEDLTKLKF